MICDPVGKFGCAHLAYTQLAIDVMIVVSMRSYVNAFETFVKKIVTVSNKVKKSCEE